jgi:cytochrome P450
LEGLQQRAGVNGVQMHEFFLHEAQAQLQMALFGMDEHFMEQTNQGIRDAFAGINPDENYAKDMCLTMLDKVGENEAFACASDEEVMQHGKPVFGPLSKSVDRAGKELGMNLKDQFGNMMLILFAGHDTTAHTMTWLTYELARHPDHQARLHAEVDQFFAELGEREMEYEDCSKLPFMSRCVMETLRLWPAVATGTYRELQFADTVKGVDGTPVHLPKGTYVHVQTWTRHRSEGLWGPDAAEWNPDRAFVQGEVWDGQPFMGYNPATKRFSPFTYEPRDCLGKNFAQMEMRTIMANVLRKCAPFYPPPPPPLPLVRQLPYFFAVDGT